MHTCSCEPVCQGCAVEQRSGHSSRACWLAVCDRDTAGQHCTGASRLLVQRLLGEVRAVAVVETSLTVKSVGRLISLALTMVCDLQLLSGNYRDYAQKLAATGYVVIQYDTYFPLLDSVEVK